jgi:ABC-type branched-subunit amino acid transport system substrate-binding protein
MGADPAGNALHVAMPRYRMAREDMQDLVAYLHQLGEEKDPGVTADAVRIGVLVPREGPLAGMGRAVQAALAARFEALNRQGGLYGRKIELKVGETTGPPEQQRGWTADFLEREGVFAAAGAMLVGADAELAALFDERKVPLVGPFTLDPRESFPLNRHVFYLTAGPAEQARALVDHARKLPWGEKPKAWGVLAPAAPSLDGAVEAARKQAKAAGWPEAKVLRYGGAGPMEAKGPARAGGLPEPAVLALPARGPLEDEAALRAFAAAGVDPIVFLGTGAEARSLLEQAERIGWHPHVLGVATAGEGLFQAPPSFAEKLVLALPALPGAATQEAADAYRALATEYRLPAEHVSAQLAALASAEVLIDALQRLGRDLSRDKLVAQLETLRRFQTGFAPPLTFGPNQRLGARGAYVFPIDLAQRRLAPEGGWLEVGE